MIMFMVAFPLQREMSRFDRKCMAHKAQNIYYLAFDHPWLN